MEEEVVERRNDAERCGRLGAPMTLRDPPKHWRLTEESHPISSQNSSTCDCLIMTYWPMRFVLGYL